MLKATLRKYGLLVPAESEETWESHYQSGLELARQDRHEEALSVFKRALHSENLAEIYLAMGDSLECLGQAKKAIQAYREAAKLDQNCCEAYRRLGTAYDRSGQFLEAIRMHLKAIRFQPDDVRLRKNLGLTYFNFGSYSEAIKAYQQALQINPDDAEAIYQLGLVYLDLRDHESARQQQALLKELEANKLAAELMDEIDRQELREAKC